MIGGVAFRTRAANRKLSPVRMADVPDKYDGKYTRRPEPHAPFVCATYVSIAATCPRSCPFYQSGCFVDAGYTAQLSRRLNDEAQYTPAAEIGRREAAAIDKAFVRGVPQDGARGGRDLRLHVGGDMGSPTGVRLLAAAARRWRDRGGGVVWTYTHWWRKVPRPLWGDVVVFASIESPHSAKLARQRGYRIAITLPEFPSDRRFELDRIPGSGQGGGEPVVPCPAETRGATCVECRLCLRPTGPTIGFAVHGRSAKRARAALRVLR